MGQNHRPEPEHVDEHQSDPNIRRLYGISSRSLNDTGDYFTHHTEDNVIYLPTTKYIKSDPSEVYC